MKTLLFVLLLSFSLVAQAQATLTNDDVIKLVKLGLSPSVVAAKIKATPGKYDTSVDALTALKAAGASEEIIVAMIEAGAPRPSSVTPTPSAPTSMLASAEHGDLSELRLKSKVFIQADNPTALKAIREEIAKYQGLTLVSAESEADFLVSYGNEIPSNNRLTGEMMVFTRTANPAHPIRIYWHTVKVQNGRRGWSVNRPPEVNAARDLIKAFEKIRGEK